MTVGSYSLPSPAVIIVPSIFSMCAHEPCYYSAVDATELQLLQNGSGIILTGNISAGSGWSDGTVTILSCLGCAKLTLNETDWPLYIPHNITQPGLNTFTVIVENPCGEKRNYSIGKYNIACGSCIIFTISRGSRSR